ncbi:MAG: VOC family protein [Victivallales bacterium]|jgi:glyoxylase I family protein|nr:VOC family protein [Victivallales bacterium]MBT7303407.1 VOC family protein [Victivallales bacterium]
MSSCVTSGFHHVAIRVADFEAACAFYIDGLGFTQKAEWGEGDSRAALVDSGGGNYVEIFAGGVGGDIPQGHCEHFAFRTDDCDAALAAAVAAGAEVTMAAKSLTIEARPTPVPVRIAFVRTPTGQIVEFFQNELT